MKRWGKNTVERMAWVFGLVAVCVFPRAMWSQLSFDARETGMAFSNAAVTRGLGQVGGNPALLAVHQSFNFEFNLLSLTAGFSNNSYTKSQYDKYFTSGDFLNEEDKNDILNSIPGKALESFLFLRANTLAFYTRNFSLSLVGMGNGRFSAPKDLFEIALRGNPDSGRRYDFSGLDGAAWGGFGALFSAGVPISSGSSELFDNIAVGGTVKYLGGLGYAEIVKGDGSLLNGSDMIVVDAQMEMRTAEGGRGWGLDLGGYAQLKKKWFVSLALLNMVGSINWNKNTELQILEFKADSISIPDGIKEELVTDTDTTLTIDDFSTRLPVVLQFGAAYQMNSTFLFTFQYDQGLNKSMGGSTTPRVAVGSEMLLTKIVPLRAGFSFGGEPGFSFAVGTGLDLKYWILDLSYVSHRALFPGSSKGATVAATTRFRF